jgi:hypothetical protein
LKKVFLLVFIMCSVSSVFNIAIAITSKKGAQKIYNKTISRSMKFDAIIVPGIPFKNGGWDSVMKARVIWSWILYKNGIAKNIIYSGGAVYSPFKEAIIMGLYAQKLGIPAEHIFYDTAARHSTENIYYSYLIAKQVGFKSLALATDPFQSFLLRGFTRKRFATPIYHIPFVTDSLKIYNYLNPGIDPNAARVTNFQSITEKESFWERMRGTLGKNIDWSKYPSGRLGPL